LGRTELKPGVSEARPIAPLPQPGLAPEKPGYVKVRLLYLTPEPQHLRSLQLAYAYSIRPPYNEEVAILLPRMKVFTLLETFIPFFETLQNSGVISKDSKLRDFRILDEDNLTLSYIF